MGLKENDERVLAVLGGELESAISECRRVDGGRMKLALQYFDGTLPANDNEENPKDRHRAAVSLDVADMVEAVYAQIAPTLEDAGGIEFEAVSAEDEAEAVKESAIVRAMLMDGYKGEGGFVALSESIKDALLMRTGSLAIWIDRQETRTPEEYENVPALGLGELTTPSAPGQRIENINVEPEDGDEDDQGEAGFSVSFDRVDVDKRLCIGAVAPENFVTSNRSERDPNRARFCGDRIVTTRAALVAQGFEPEKVAMLKEHDPSAYELHIDRLSDGRSSEREGLQTATQTVEVWRLYAMLSDSENSTEAARYRCYYSRDSGILLREPERVGRVCYAVGNVLLYPHRRDGISLFDRIGEIQELKSTALRNWDENLHKVNRPRLGVDESLCNLADARDGTLDVIRVRGPGAIVPVPVIDAGPSVQAFLAYQDQARSERGGASLDMQTATGQIATNQTAAGIDRQYSVKEQLAATMARTFAETALRSAWQIAHYLLRTSWGGPIEAKLGGQWSSVDPSKWRARTGVVVRVGESQSDRARKSAALGQVMQWQAQAIQAGKSGVLTDDKRMFNAASDWIGASKLRAPERYLIDPESQGAQQVAQGQAQQQQASMLAQGEASKAMLQLEKYKVDVNALTDLIGHIVKAAVEEAKLTLSTQPLDQAEGMATAAAGSVAQGAAKADPGGAK